MKESLDAAEVAVGYLLENHLTAATVESCTGGLIAKRLTDIPGVSECYLGGAVTYANSVKTAIAGVKPETLRAVGAVSAEVAREMAAGIRRVTGADRAVSTTGIAGPGGGTDKKPVGLVYVGYSDKNETYSVKLLLGAEHSREEIRKAACDFALSLLAGANPDEKLY